MRVYVVHVYDAADHLYDYYVHGTIEGAVGKAAVDVSTVPLASKRVRA